MLTLYCPIFAKEIRMMSDYYGQDMDLELTIYTIPVFALLALQLGTA